MTYNHSLLKNFSEPKDTVLDLMCGKGDSVECLSDRFVTGVDIYEPYINAAREKYKDNVRYMFFVQDSVEYLKGLKDNSVDVTQSIDGIEHLPEEVGLELLNQMERVSKKAIVIFTPDGFTENHPHDAWGIQGGDVHQKHLSGWSRTWFEARGYVCEDYTQWNNAYTGEVYHSMLMVKRK